MFEAQDGRAVVVAFDHGTEGAVRGGEDVPRMMRIIAGSRADGVLLTTGAARHFPRPQTPGRGPQVIAGLDVPVFGTGIGTGGKLVTTRQLWCPADAAAAGAGMCKMLLPLGLTDTHAWADAVERIGRAGADAVRTGLPFMVEPAFWGPDAQQSDRAILDAARLGIELGADVLKVPGPRDPDVLATLVRWSPIPVLVLGGTPRDGSDFLTELVSWLDAGAAGVVVGRNVWNRPDPVAAIEALAQAVHDGDAAGARRSMRAAGDPLPSAALRYDDGGSDS